jgi:uncharacterized membrane protein YgcG
MRCPSCHAPLQERSSCCPQCQFDLESAGRGFGLCPVLQAPLTDLAEALSPHQARVMQKALAAFPQRFPQMLFHVVIAKLPEEQKVGAVAFWLFNQGGLCTPMEKGGSCQDALLLLDVEHDRAACIIGYGLEPFVSQETLDQITQAALPALHRKQCHVAVHDVLRKAGEVFAAACASTPGTFGLNAHDIYDAPHQEGAFAY